MLIHKRFEKNVDIHGSQIAVSMGDRSITYSALDEMANKMAHELILRGVKPGDVVGVSLKRSPELVASVLGILKTGAAYLPLDPGYPSDRLKYMVEHSQVKLIFTTQDSSPIFSQLTCELIEIEKTDFSKQPVIRPELDESGINLCYVIYTSGSTGKPKGVSLGHKALGNLLDWQSKQSGPQENLLTLQFTPLSFDVHFQEFFSTLCSGGHLVLIDESLRLNPSELLKVLSDKKIARIFLPFVALQELAEVAVKISLFPISLKRVTTAGEQLKITPAIRKFFSEIPESILYNHYGPSETHVVSSHTLDGDPSRWEDLPPIGKAIDNCQIFLLNENLEKVIEGTEGELFLGGICLADGYLNAPELTEERFIQHPNYGRLYKTGDLGIVQADGSIQFLGRKDGQVKIRGYRIEIGEIEVALQKINEIEQCAAKVIEISSEKFICAYFVSNSEVINLRKYLQKSLPDYMVPTHFVKLDELPKTPSGKVNYNQLPMPSGKRPDLMNDFVAPETESEKNIAKIWRKHLHLDEVGVLDNFFDLGGTSILAIRIMVELNHEFNRDTNVITFFQAPTIKQLAQSFEAKKISDFVFERDEGQLSAPIAVIGLSGRFPGARDVEEFWSNLLMGKTNLEKFNKEEAEPSLSPKLLEDPDYRLIHGVFPEQKCFDYKFFGMTPREAELMDPQQRKFLELSVEALEAAGYFGEDITEVIGVFAGMANSKYSRLVDQYPEKVANAGEFNVMLGLEKDYIATRVAHKLNLTGPALSIHTGCSTSLVAIIEAVKSIRAGDCTMALAGGISISGHPNSGYLYQEEGILSQDGTCRPFDDCATGTVFTEGAGIVVLKRLDRAIASGDNIIGVIRGVGINNDGSDKMSFTAPSVKGQAQAIYRAQKDAGIDPRTISFIEAHGTATPVGDPIEVEALRQAFTASTHDKNFCVLGSVKSNVGHLTAAAGVAGFIKALMVVNRGIVPGTANYKKPNELLRLEDSPFVVTSENVQLPKTQGPLRAGVSSFGVGGTNAHVIIEEYQNHRKTDHDESEPSLFKLSAKSDSQLNVLRQKLLQKLTITPPAEWAKIAYTLEVGRKNFSHRSFLTLSSLEDLKATISSDKNINHLTDVSSLYLMFPGQGSQYLKMGKKLAQSSLIFKMEVDRASEILKQIAGYDIRQIMWEDSCEEKLNNTFYAQPAIFIISYAVGKTLLSLGYKFEGFIGHSIGEYAAATLAGIFSLEDGIKIIAKRAELMNKLSTGAMLSVSASFEIVKSAAEKFDLDIAAVNGSKSIVVAGEIKKIEQLQLEFEAHEIASIILKTSHAFHSRMMRPMVKEFKEYIDGIEKRPSLVPIHSTVTLTTNGPELMSSEYWAEHIVRTVLFEPAMKMLQEKVDTAVCVEAGPNSVLTKLTTKISVALGKKKSLAIATLTGKADLESITLLNVIGKVWTLGHGLPDGRILYRKEDQCRVLAPLYPFEKNELWLKDRTSNREDSFKETKIQRPKITEEAMNDLKKTEFTKRLVDLFETSSGIDMSDFDNDTCFLEMGMDSLFLTQMALKLKKEFNIQLNFRQLLEDYGSINALASSFVSQVEISLPENTETILVETKVPEALLLNLPKEQIQIQQKALQTTSTAPITTGSGLEMIIQRQLDLMNEQLQILKGGAVSPPFNPVTELKMEPVVAPQVSKASAPTVSLKTTTEKSRGADIKTAKDSFGAAAKIIVEKNSKYTPDQERKIQDFFRSYISKTASSRKFTQENRKAHADPRVVTGFKPENKEIIYPIVIKKSHQQYLWDLDNNTYIDMLCGFGSNFFGNGNERIKKLVLQQIEEGIELGPQHPLVGEVSQLINELTGNERTAFCNTGSEAVLGAMRVARTVTGREKIVVFSGSYHGINDEVIIRGARTKPFPAAPGINDNAVSNMIVLDYGTPESLEYIRKNADDLAAVLVEPVQSRRCDFHPVEFLKEVRRITESSQTCLIFDEVITGFRINLAGAQGHFGIRADLCTYGKIVGGGMPIGVISGKAEYMDALDGGHWTFGDDSTPTVGVTYFAGTFVRHPLALAAAKGSLLILKEGGNELLANINKKASDFAGELNTFCREHKIPLEMHHFGSLMKPKWTEEVLGGELLFALLRYHGVHTYDGFPWFVNMAHSEQDLKEVLRVFKLCLAKLQEIGLLTGSIKINSKSVIFDANKPPMAGARLGRDDKGNPAWFMEDPSNPGEYFLVEV